MTDFHETWNEDQATGYNASLYLLIAYHVQDGAKVRTQYEDAYKYISFPQDTAFNLNTFHVCLFK